jgi:hypothetical protein
MATGSFDQGQASTAAGSLGPVDLCCDAPPYPVVEACRLIGLRSPEDVRWCRAHRFLGGRLRWLEPMAARIWEALSTESRPPEVTCDCRQPLVPLMKYQFTFDTGDTAYYRIGQCDRCSRIYWSEA